MSRILLADDSPHAQRMGERILREEGYEVVSVTDGQTALMRLADVDPDVILADVFLPGRSGIELCRAVKQDPQRQHVRIVLTAGLLETFDEAEATSAGADAIIKKPFEASVVIQTIKPLSDEAYAARGGAPQPPAEPAPLEQPPREPEPVPPVPPAPPVPFVPPEPKSETPEPAPAVQAAPASLSDEERIRAAVTIALDSAFPSLVEQITQQLLTVRAASLQHES